MHCNCTRAILRIYESAVLLSRRQIDHLSIMDMIPIKSVLAQIKTGKPFTLKWVSYDKNRKTGGMIKTAQARIAGAERKTNNNIVSYHTIIKKKKKPNHHLHGTYNIELLSDGEPTDIIRKVHWMLILVFNGKKVHL